MGLAEWSIASDAPRSWTRVMQPHQRWRKSTISTGKAWLTGTRAPCAPMLGNPSDICKDDVRRPSVDGLKGQVTPTGRAGWTPLRRHFHPSSTGRGFFLRSQKRYRLKALKMLYKRLSDGIFARSRPGALGAAVRPVRAQHEQMFVLSTKNCSCSPRTVHGETPRRSRGDGGRHYAAATAQVPLQL